MLISSLCLKNTPKMLKWKKKRRTIQPIVLNYGCGLGTQIAWGVMSWFKDDQVHSLSIHVYETLETPSKYKFLFEDVVPPPLAHLLRWKQDNFRQSISDKSVVLLGTSWCTQSCCKEPLGFWPQHPNVFETLSTTQIELYAYKCLLQTLGPPLKIMKFQIGQKSWDDMS